MLVHELWQDGERLALGVTPFVPNKHLDPVDPHLSASVAETAAGFEIAVTSQHAARFVWLELDGHDVILGDNCFDLPAGRTVCISLSAQSGLSVDQVCDRLRMRSLHDTF